MSNDEYQQQQFFKTGSLMERMYKYNELYNIYIMKIEAELKRAWNDQLSKGESNIHIKTDNNEQL